MALRILPTESTVYVSNLPYELKTNDLHKVFGKYGQIVKITVLKDRHSRKSKGVAFIYFLSGQDALTCIQNTDQKEMFGRTLKASIAKDNGRSSEFSRRRNYPDKSVCYECGNEGHLSYKCKFNLLGSREIPKKKAKKKKISKTVVVDDDNEYEEDCETLSAAIALDYEKYNSEEMSNN